jgi:hypothetical protein
VDAKYKINPLSASSASVLETNSWAVSKDGGTTWLKVPASSESALTLKNTSATATDDATAVKYGYKVDFSRKAGQYSAGVHYTITANPVAAPTITGISPSSGAVGTSITINGTNFSTAYSVTVGNTACTAANIVSNTQISCIVPDKTPGAYDVAVSTWGGTAAETGGFTYENPIQPAAALDETCQPDLFEAAGQTSGGLSDDNTAVTVDLDPNMIPVQYIEIAGTPSWATAPASNDNYAWYDYNSQKWANAASLKAAYYTGAFSALTTTEISNLCDAAFTYDTDFVTWILSASGNSLSASKNLCPTLEVDDFIGGYYAHPVDVIQMALANSGTVVISEDAVAAYWTYIPRYRYQVQRCNALDAPVATPSLFIIQFENKSDAGYEKAYPAVNGDWVTHPAFTFGGSELNGIWVAKFEASTATTNPSSDANARTNVSNGRVYIKPNQYSLRYLNTASQFKLSRLMGPGSGADKTALNVTQINNQTVTYQGNGLNIAAGNFMNFAGGENQINTRMAKNDDWGAIAYLSASVYGTGVASGNEPGLNGSVGGIRINSNSAYTTGCGPIDNTGSTTTYSGGLTCTSSSVNKSYYTDLGVLASSTKNVYGVYDLSGGLYEYTMTVYSDTAGIPRSGYYCQDYSTVSYFSGFNGRCDGSGSVNPSVAGIDYPDGKYYNLYRQDTAFTNNSNSTNNRQCTYATCGGQALHEVWTGTGASGTSSNYRWNGDYALFVVATNPWFLRGGLYGSGSNAGVFNSYYTDGNANSGFGFRPLMSVF